MTAVSDVSKANVSSWDQWEEYMHYACGGVGVLTIAFRKAEGVSADLRFDFAITEAAAALDPAIRPCTYQRDGVVAFKLLCPLMAGDATATLRCAAEDLSRRLAAIGLREEPESVAARSRRTGPAPSMPLPKRVTPPPRRLLLQAVHISDIHVGAGNAAWRHDQARVAAALVNDLRRVIWGALRPRLFITGDISFSASEQQYADAARHIREIVAACGSGMGDVRMVPGNHDCDRSQSGTVLARLLHEGIRRRPDALDDVVSDIEANSHLVRKLKNFQSFVAGIDGHPRDLDWRDELGDGIALLGLATVLTSDKDDAAGSTRDGGNLVVGRAQLARLVPPGSRDQLRILLSHHPLEWLPRSSQEWVTEATATAPCLQLCGHVHTMEGLVRRPIGVHIPRIVLNAGAAHQGLNEPGSHTYCRLQVVMEHDGSLSIGWSPRIYQPFLGVFHCDASRHPDMDKTGFVWERLPGPVY
jgi:hypothetical protein